MAEYLKIIEFNNVNENEGIDESRFSTGHHEYLGEIKIGNEQIEGRGKEYVRVTLQNEDNEREAGVFVAKKFASKAEALKELKKCWYFEKYGIPVPPTHRYVEQDGRHYVVYTDLSQGGKNEVWSGNVLREEKKRPDLTTEQFDEVAYQIRDIAEKASARDFSINGDAYFIVKQPDGTVSVIVGDLGYGVSEYPVSSANVDVETINKEEADWLIACIKGD